MSNSGQRGMGWLRDPPDFRDIWIEIKKPRTAKRAAKTTTAKAGRATLELCVEPSRTDNLADVAKTVGTLRFPYPPPTKHLGNVEWCSPIEDQRTLGSCTAQAGVGLLEYYQGRVYGKHVDGSKLFLYKATRNLLGLTGDTGAYCRTTMKAMAMLGVALEDYWPYTDADSDFDKEPSSFVYALAQNYQGTTYHRIDAAAASLPLLTRIKTNIAFGWPPKCTASF